MGSLVFMKVTILLIRRLTVKAYICIRMKGIFAIVLGILSLSVIAQRVPVNDHVVQVSGVVLVSDSLYPAPFVGVVRTRDQRGTYADRNGYFTLPVIAGDTLEFFFLGFKTSLTKIPESTTETNLSLVQVMAFDSITLPTVNILPYPAPHALGRELANLDLPGDNYVSFSRTMASISRYDGMADFSERAYRNASNDILARYNNGFQSGGNLLNADGWNKFLKSMKR